MMPIRSFKVILPILVLLSSCYYSLIQAQTIIPDDFYDSLVDDSWNQAVGFTFDAQGNLFLWEKAGVLHRIPDTGVKPATPLLDISEEVASYIDHGLLGFALDPNFQQNGFIYTLYIVDRHYWEFFGTPQYSPDSSAVNVATFARLTRFTVETTTFNSIVPGSRKVLIGADKEHAIPILYQSHGVGTLVFGTDNSLLLSTGDGTTYQGQYVGTNGSGPHSYAAQGLIDGIIRPEEDIGAYRAQLLNSYNGKILRVDPATGFGIPSNPYYDSARPDAPISKVWAMGLRNPFRMSLRPGTGSHNQADGDPGVLYIGDVGGSKWEEINVADQPGENFGWPIFEGMDRFWGFDQFKINNLDAPNPLYNTGGCQQEYFVFQDLLTQETATPIDPTNPCNTSKPIDGIPTFQHTRPSIAYSNAEWNKPTRTYIPAFDSAGFAIKISVLDPGCPVVSDTFNGGSHILGDFYSGQAFPPAFQNSLYSGDFNGWIKQFIYNNNQELEEVRPICEGCGPLVGMKYNPHDECLYYIKYEDQLRKICFGGNPAPVAVAIADVYYGPSPLTVQFTGDLSYDPNSLPISFHWDFGDGTTSTLMNPVHQFTAPTNAPHRFNVVLTVTDSLAESGSEEIVISPNNTPPAVAISSFSDGDFYPISGTTILPLEAVVSDNESANSELTFVWQVHFHHNTHSHPEPQVYDQTTTALINPAGCIDGNYWYRVTLEVTDPHGLSTLVEGSVYPNCDPIFFELLDLDATPYRETVDLTWESTKELDTDYYIVQRSKGDNFYTDLGIVDAKGVGSSYEFIDESPMMGFNYYRLKAYNNAGHYEYSNLVTARFPVFPKQFIYPNPATNSITIYLEDVEELATFRLFDASGKLVFDDSWDVTGRFEEIFSIDQLASGVYFYVLHDGIEGKCDKLVIY